MNELSCKTFLDIRNDLKRLDVITEHDYIFAYTIKELCSVRDGAGIFYKNEMKLCCFRPPFANC